MLTFEEAKKIGLNACVDRLGRDFVMKYRDTSCPAYADMEDHAYCFIGVDNSDSTAKKQYERLRREKRRQQLQHEK